MPSRPRQHELESISRNKFDAAVLSQGWLPRDVDSSGDYGVDEEVEIFDSGVTTGFRFAVQLKGSDQAINGSGPKIDIRLEHFAYWSSLDMPVLLVVWVSHSDSLYCRWVHRYDFGPGGLGEKTRRVTFTDRDLLQKRLLQLQEEVKIFRALGHGSLPRPIPLALDVPTEGDLPKYQLAFEQVKRQAGVGNQVILTQSASSSFTARVTSDRLRVESPADLASFNMQIHDYTSYSPKEIAYDILTGLGVLLARLGSERDASRLVSAGAINSRVAEIPEPAVTIADLAVHEEDATLLLNLMTHVLPARMTPIGDDLFKIYLSGLVQVAHLLTKDQARGLRRVARRTVADESDSGLSEEPARLAFNTAVIMKLCGQWKHVEPLLDIACRLSPKAYGQRTQVSLMRGNARWNLGDLDGALIAYLEAEGRGAPSAEIVPPLSDVLLNLGRYSEALDRLNQWYADDSSRFDPRSALRLIILTGVVDRLGLDEQSRRSPEETQIADVEQCSDEVIIDALRATDALNISLWTLTSGESYYLQKMALYAFDSDAASAWIMTVILAKAEGWDEALVTSLLRGASNSSGFFDASFDLASRITDEEGRNIVEELVRDAADATGSLPEVHRFNLVSEDNQVVASISVDPNGIPIALWDEVGNLVEDGRQDPDI